MAAAYMRNVMYVLSLERNSFLTRGNGLITESKRYVRGLRRRPVKVLFPEEEAVKQPERRQKKEPHFAAAAPAPAPHPGGKNDFIRARSREQSPLKSPYVAAAEDKDDRIRIDKALPGDKRLATVVSAARSRTFREHQGKILLEGRRLICDALNAGANPQMVFFSTGDRLNELPLEKLKKAALIKVRFEDIKIWSDLVAPQGVIAIFSRPDSSKLSFDRNLSVPMTLICDNVRDPGNLGTILRCAAAAGCSEVLLSKGCVDAWEPKVLRGAMGAHFRLPIYPNLTWNNIQSHLSKTVTVHAADNRSDMSRETEDTPSTLSRVGDYGWVSMRKNHNNMHYTAEHSSDSSSDSDDGELSSSEDELSSSDDEALSLPRVKSKLYHETWAQSPTALVVGGETHGLSWEALKLVEKTDGRRLFIPIVPGVDSLNSAMAASILLFEGRKQLLRLIQTSGEKWKSEAKQQLV